jgi:hypothetical protein
VLLAFAIELERESDVSLAISANVLALLDDKDEKGVRLRDLPIGSGLSKEAISMAVATVLHRGNASGDYTHYL